MNKPTSKTIAQTLKRHQTRILKKANVVGVGVGVKIKAGRPMGQLCLKVYVQKKIGKEKLAGRDLVPPHVGKIQTDVEEIGIIKPLAFTQRLRPAPPGVSIGHYRSTAGTLGCIVKDGQTGQTMMLSNNHVLANSNAGKKGDAVIQPGAADGGKLKTDKIGELDRWVQIRFKSTPNTVDCALARPLNAKDVKTAIIGSTAPKGTTTARLGLVVQKTGRTTEFTMGKVRDISATVKVPYPDGGVAVFVDQILTSAMSQGGDSGSLVTDQKNRAVGLLFAGSEVVTICNPIPAVLKSLDVRF